MSYQNFQEAVLQIPQCGYFRSMGGYSEERISRSEEIMGVKLSRQHRELFQRFGYLFFGFDEFYLLDPDNISDKPFMNLISEVLLDRREYGLPEKWIHLHFFDDGYYAFMDYSALNAEGEPPVIMGTYNGDEYEEVEFLAEDLGEYLLQRLKEYEKYEEY